MIRQFLSTSLMFMALSSSAFAEMIHLHAKRGNIEGVVAELDKGVALDIRSTNMTSALGVTPLFVAAKFGHVELVEELLSRGADPNIFFYQDDGIYTVGTALHHAAGYGHKEVVRVLIDAGADPASYEAYISTPLHQALRSGHLDIATMLVEAGAPRRVKFPSIANAVENADPTRGAELARGCEICHGVPSSSGELGDNGPNLWGIYGRAAASDPSFEYSTYLRELDLIWDADTLNNYLGSPYQFVPGTKKVMLGLAEEDDRASLVAYLATLSD